MIALEILIVLAVFAAVIITAIVLAKRSVRREELERERLVARAAAVRLSTIRTQRDLREEGWRARQQLIAEALQAARTFDGDQR